MLYKGFRRRGRGVCIKKCPLGYKAKENHMGGNECVRRKYFKEMLSVDLISFDYEAQFFSKNLSR